MSPLETIFVALVGATLALLAMTQLGLNAHIGTTVVTGPAAYILTAVGGAFAAVMMRLALLKTFGF